MEHGGVSTKRELDQFDSLGHAAGGQVLRKVGAS